MGTIYSVRTINGRPAFGRLHVDGQILHHAHITQQQILDYKTRRPDTFDRYFEAVPGTDDAQVSEGEGLVEEGAADEPPSDNDQSRKVKKKRLIR